MSAANDIQHNGDTAKPQFYADIRGSGSVSARNEAVAESAYNTCKMVVPLPVSSVEQPVAAAARERADDIKLKVESRLLSMWNNVKFGWTVKLKTNFSKESPVWLLGRCYHRKLSPTGSVESSTEIATEATAQQGLEQLDGEGIEGFKLDFISKLWMTYRREFPIMSGSTFTTDCGWGCMLRSGQMLLAQALTVHFLGRSWRWTPDRPILNAREFQEDYIHRTIVKWFGDKPSANSPLSIHQMVRLGASLGKKPGDWYGPASVAHCLRAVVAAAALENYQLDQLEVYVAQESTVYAADVRSRCRLTDGAWKSLVLLVPVKLGTDKLNPIYGPCLTSLLTLDCCIGIIGGRPKHSLYFVGYQDDKLIHLDPHYCQETVDVCQADFPLSTFHCRSPRKMPISKMDPSCCIGFYLPEPSQFDAFASVIKPLLVPQGVATSHEYPMFSIAEGARQELDDSRNIRYSIYETEHNWVVPNINDSDTDIESEEFVLV